MNEPNSEAPRITGGFSLESAFAFQFQEPVKDEKLEEKPQSKEATVNTRDLEEAHYRLRDLSIRFDFDDLDLSREIDDIANLIYRNLR